MLSAYSWGIPWSSRSTPTSPVRPGTSMVPSTCGKGRRTSTTPSTRAATSISTSSTRAYAVHRTLRGQPWKTCQGVRSRAPGGNPVAVMVVVIVPYHWQSTGESASLTEALHVGAERHRRGTVPTYQYACTECAHAFEQFQSFSDDALTECPECHGRLRKVFNAVGVVFKGSGFYRTDSRDKKPSTTSADGSTKTSEATKSETKSADSSATSSSSKSSTSSTSSSSDSKAAASV